MPSCKKKKLIVERIVVAVVHLYRQEKNWKMATSLFKFLTPLPNIKQVNIGEYTGPLYYTNWVVKS